MPTYETDPRFRKDMMRLSAAERRAFRLAVAKFVADLRTGRLRNGLRVTNVEGHPGDWEMTWADDGRATFMYGPEIRPGEPHVVWRRVGGHEIFEDP